MVIRYRSCREPRSKRDDHVVQLHGTGTLQIVRIIRKVDDRYMTDCALLQLYRYPKPEQVMGDGLG